MYGMDDKGFIKFNLSQLKQQFHEQLQSLYVSEEIESLFFIVVAHELGWSRLDLAMRKHEELDPAVVSSIKQILSRLVTQEPIQYILESAHFFGLDFKVTPSVLIPRSETEELVALILKDCKHDTNLHILDIGTGSGCIPISLKYHLKSAAHISAIDVSDAALDIARYNAQIHQTEINFSKVDILHDEMNTVITESKFDIIVSNPPYVRHLEKLEIKPNVLEHEPHLALFVPNEDPLLFYKAIAEYAVNNLVSQGWLYFEINQYLGQDMIELLEYKNFQNIELIKDLHANDRIIKAQKP